MLFSDARAAIQPENLPNLLNDLPALAQRTYGLVLRVADFATTVIAKILELIKNALLGWLSEYAGSIPGFNLLTVIVGVNPFTGAEVQRTAENLIRGFITLMPGGEATYDQLAQTGVIADAAARIEEAISALGITPELVVGTFRGIWDTFSLDDLLDPISAFVRVLDLFGEPLLRLIQFVGVVIEVVVTLVLRLMNFPSELLASVISNTKSAITDIQRDPVGFLLNMMEALKAGFLGFFENIGKYLLDGLVAWLFRGLGQLGITLPTDYSLGSILDLIFQVLGLSIEHLWEKLAENEHIGPERVAMIRDAIDTLTGVWTFVQDVQREGLSAVWSLIQDQLGAIWQTLLETAMEWVMTQLITSGMIKLLSFLDPTFIMSVVNGCIALFNAVQAAIEYARDMLEILNLYVGTLAQVAAGNIAPGAEMIEAGLAAAVPMAIGFLAYLLGIDDVPKRIADIVLGIREAIDRAIDWLIEQALRLGAAALNALGLGDGGGGGTPEERKQVALRGGPRRHDARHPAQRARRAAGRPEVAPRAAALRARGRLGRRHRELGTGDGRRHSLLHPGGSRGGDRRRASATGTKGKRDIQVSKFETTGEKADTVRGLLEPYYATWIRESGKSVPWPRTFANMEPKAMRPEHVTAQLTGVIGIPVTDVPRISVMTGRVGDMGDIEHAVRGNVKQSTKKFEGGQRDRPPARRPGGIRESRADAREPQRLPLQGRREVHRQKHPHHPARQSSGARGASPLRHADVGHDLPGDATAAIPRSLT